VHPAAATILLQIGRQKCLSGNGKSIHFISAHSKSPMPLPRTVPQHPHDLLHPSASTWPSPPGSLCQVLPAHHTQHIDSDHRQVKIVHFTEEPTGSTQLSNLQVTLDRLWSFKISSPELRRKENVRRVPGHFIQMTKF
jgi:hypothetical protein